MARLIKPTDGGLPEELLSAFHVVYGLQLAANMALPGLPVRRNSETVDVRIQLKDAWPFPGTLLAFGEGFYSSSDGAPASQPNLQVGLSSNGEHFGFFYGDGARFAVDRHGRDVRADWPEDYTLEDACTYLLGPVMGFVLRLRGKVCLHASAVDRKSTRLNSSHVEISYAVFCLKKKKKNERRILLRKSIYVHQCVY